MNGAETVQTRTGSRFQSRKAASGEIEQVPGAFLLLLRENKC